MVWTNWKILTDGYQFDRIQYNGPACYELGIGRLKTKPDRPSYVGKTGNLRVRMSKYGSTFGDHLKLFFLETF